MPIYEEAFQLEYPLPKLDTLVTHDFAAGAMENWLVDTIPKLGRSTISH